MEIVKNNTFNKLAHHTQGERLDHNPATVYLARLSQGSRRAMRGALETAARIFTGQEVTAEAFPWHMVEYQHMGALRSQLVEEYAHTTANKILSAVRGVLRECWKLGKMEGETYQTAASVENVKGDTLPSGRMLAFGEMAALGEVCREDNSKMGARDAALIAVLGGGGLRRAEAVALDRDHYDEATGEIQILQGKRNKSRTIYLNDRGQQTMTNWLETRGDEPGPLFYRIRRGDNMTTDRLTSQAVYKILKKRGGQAKIKDFSPHDLRRTVASTMIDNGVDLVTVQKIMGHSSPTTTARYDRRGERAKQKASDAIPW